ncbi:glycosyl hydrolase 53 family protein [Paenibacillus tritici]|uniref:glycosyl hydrolase 53 family protein n=1 Tax=Paenibacillus tritici TaxID=1873425 RepID=UPI001BA5414B|nr:glycosyl hydrolase 53 family protein [Paenibacillus tritici]QUL57106.1 glycosyl hydrolase 53 family protein [Paenibacillus tritici]
MRNRKRNSNSNNNSNRILAMLLSLAMILSMASIGVPARASASPAPDSFSKGADISWLPQLEALGYKFYNDDGQEQDLLQILKDHGIDSIRIRAWVNPSDDPANGHNSTEEVVALASRVSALGFRVMIDFHYSDTWADPGKQVTPAAWAGDNLEQLKAHVSAYTSEVMNALKAAGVTPEWVQIGNEINNGMLHPLGSYSNTSNLVQLIQAGSSASKAVFPGIKVIIHRANGAEAGVDPFFAGLVAAGLQDSDYDIIGLSYYPDAVFTSSINELGENMNKLEANYGKEVMVVEVGGDVSKDVDSVYNMLVAVQNKLHAVPKDRGTGIFYWEPAGILFGYPLSAWNRDGTPTLAMDAFIDGAAEINLNPVTSVTLDKSAVTIEVGGTGQLSAILEPANATYRGVEFTSSKPEVVRVDRYNGIISGISAGSATVTAVTYDGGFQASSEISVIPSTSLVQNPGFEDGLNEWTLTGDTSAVSTDKDVHSGALALHYYSADPAEFTASQTLTGLDNGTYSLSAWVSGGGSEEVSEIFAGNTTQSFTNTGWQQWTKAVLDSIEVTDGTLTLGAHYKLSDGQWGNIDDFELIKKDNTRLADLKVNGETVPGFNPKIQDYEVVLPHGTTALPTVEAKTIAGAEAVVTQATALPGSARVVVTGDGTATYTLHFTVDPNPVVNPGFEHVNEEGLPEGWTLSDTTPLASNSARTGTKSLGFWKETAYTLEASQTLTGLTNGTYTLSAWSQGAGDEVKNELFAVNGDQARSASSFANKGWNEWNQAVVEQIKVTDGTLRIGVSQDAKARNWGSYDDFVLLKTSDAPGTGVPPTIGNTDPVSSGSGNGSNGGNDGNGGNSRNSESSTPLAQVVTLVTGSTTTYTVKIKATRDLQSNIATAKLEPGLLADLLPKIKVSEAAGQQAVIDIKVEGAATDKAVQVSLSKEALTLLAEMKNVELKVDTGMAAVTFNSKALAALGDSPAGDRLIRIRELDHSGLPVAVQTRLRDRPVVDISVWAGNAEVREFNGEKLGISLPYAPRANEKTNAIVGYRIDQAGILQPVRGGYDASTGQVHFQTTSLADYAVGYNEVTFNDVSPESGYSGAVGYLAARGIVNGVGGNEFAPEKQVTRADFLMMVMKAYGIEPEAGVTGNFSDAGNKYYSGYLGTARKLGLVTGVGGNQFRPEATISRQDVSVIVYNLLKQLDELPASTEGKSLDSYIDSAAVSVYAQDAVKVLVQTGVITGTEHKLAPKALATRAEIAQIVFNAMK